MATLNAGISAVDRAYALRLASKSDDAARAAIAVLEANPHAFDAAVLIAQLLIEKRRGTVAGDALGRLADAFVRRGDLAQAIAAVRIAAQAGKNVLPLEEAIAKAFSKDSPRLSEVHVSPPPLLKAAAAGKDLAALSGDALWQRAERALETVIKHPDAASPTGPIPRWPLFSELGAEDLHAFLKSLSVRDAAEGEVIIQQDDHGNEAFLVVRGMAKVIKRTAAEETVLALLGPGSLFGEMALVTEAPRAASVVAVEGVRFLVLTRVALEKLVSANPAVGDRLGEFCHQRMLSNLMRTSPVFQPLNAERQKALMAKFVPHTFQAGETLVKRGEPPRSMYVIASGAVEVRALDGDGDQVHVATLGPGDVVGEIGVVLRKPATAHAIASHPTVTLELPQKAFNEAIAEYPELLQKMYPLAVERDDQIRSLLAQATLELGDIDILL
jgi:CRP-like cAMP-binding protein